MGRRANGEGTIFQRKDGRWVGQTYVLLGNGGMRRRTVYGRTRDDVLTSVTRLRAEVQRGTVASDPKVTVAAFLDEWLNDVARRTVRPRTFENYELMVRLHIVPALGRKKLNRLSAADVRKLLNAKTDDGYSASTVRHIHATLRVALEQAVRDDVLARNVARLVQSPKKPAGQVVPFDEADARRFLGAAQDDRLGALWTVALAIGLRRGEALGLHWADVDLDRAVLRVRVSLQRVGGRLQLAEPKTARSKRTIPLPAVCVEALRDHAHRQEEERRAAGEMWQESGLVFTTRIGTPVEPGNVSRWFKELCERAGVPVIRMHDLRHTCASILLAQGVPLRVVMEILGHSQIAVTADLYTHVLPALNEDAALRMQRALNPVAVNAAVTRPAGLPVEPSDST